MRLLRATAGVPPLGFLRAPRAQANANRLEESYDKASPFPERKSHLRAACCKTNARPAISPRRDRRSSHGEPIQDSRGKFAPPTAAGWRFPQSEKKTAPPNDLRARRKRRSFVPLR